MVRMTSALRIYAQALNSGSKRGKYFGQQAFARTGRAAEQQIMPTGGTNLHGAFTEFLADRVLQAQLRLGYGIRHANFGCESGISGDGSTAVVETFLYSSASVLTGTSVTFGIKRACS